MIYALLNKRLLVLKRLTDAQAGGAVFMPNISDEYESFIIRAKILVCVSQHRRHILTFGSQCPSGVTSQKSSTNHPLATVNSTKFLENSVITTVR